MKRGCTLVLLSLLTMAGGSHAQQTVPPAQPEVEIIATQRVNNREQRVIFRLDPARAGVAAVAVRSGSEPIQLQSLDIAYANGEHKNVELPETILPGRQSRLSEVDATVPIVEVVVWKRPGLHARRNHASIARNTAAGAPGRRAGETRIPYSR